MTYPRHAAFIATFLLMLLSVATASAKSAHSLTVAEGLTNPLGFHDAMPAFSWKLPAGVKAQTGYQLEVTDGRTVLWDSGWINSAQCTFVPYAGTRLASRQRVEWRVRFKDEQGKASD